VRLQLLAMEDICRANQTYRPRTGGGGDNGITLAVALIVGGQSLALAGDGKSVEGGHCWRGGRR
jgi:hypothetical protein